LVQTIISQTTFYIMSFNMLSSSKISLWEGYLGGRGSPPNLVKTIVLQAPPTL